MLMVSISRSLAFFAEGEFDKAPSKALHSIFKDNQPNNKSLCKNYSLERSSQQEFAPCMVQHEALGQTLFRWIYKE